MALLLLALPATASDDSRPLDSPFRLTVEGAIGLSSFDAGELAGGLELGWLPLGFIRLHALLGAAAIPRWAFDGALRMLFGADGVYALSWGELFLGLETGAVYTSYVPVCFDCGTLNVWEWKPALAVRGGVDFTLKRPVVLGIAAAYLFTQERFGPATHWLELHGRLGLAF